VSRVGLNLISSSYNKLEAILFEEMRRIDLLWKSLNIRQISFEYLMFTNFVALTFWLKT
jgi:hypothetical protein